MKRPRFGKWAPGIRPQLTLWYTTIFAVLLLLFGALYYFQLQRSLLDNFDASLQVRATQIAAGITFDNGAITVQDLTGELPGLPAGSSSFQTGQTGSESDGTTGTQATGNSGANSEVAYGSLVRITDAHGGTVYVSTGFKALNQPPTMSLTSAHATISTIHAPSGQLVRIYSLPLTDNNRPYALLQVGQPETALNTELRNAMLWLVILGPFALLLGAAGSYWLAGRAFQPVLRLTRGAQDIEAGDLHRRVPIPRAQDEVHELAITLNDMIERLERAFLQQQRFVSDASHELRTPVAAIRSMTDVALAQETTPEEQRAVLQDVNAEVERLGRLISDLLALARADEGQARLDADPVRLDMLANDVAAVAESLALERGVAIAVDAPTAVTVSGDEARLIQVVLNLVHNAVRHSHPGGTVTITVQLDGTQAVLSVRDTGQGIAAEHLPHIFERFYRADPSRSRVDGGTGLGLAIVQWIVTAHHGTITVASEPGQGSVFTVRLPLLIDSDSGTTMAPSRLPDSETVRFRR